ncbi:hypothetical protein AB0K02_24825 [Streptomyces sp. NPDC049597]|uniref:hypothetical protein n=1 Tax=Streptomyces sp. NPDC049597 TaxID=3155276 RepID=UPI00341D83A6
MTGWQPFTTTPGAGPVFDPYRFPGAVADERPEGAHTTLGLLEPGDFVRPAPDPGRRAAVPLKPTDRRRLDLHAVLTAAGIAPRPGDLAAIEALCALDDTTHAALQRWITRAP